MNDFTKGRILMKKRTFSQIFNDLDMVVIEVWTGEQITFRRSIIFVKELLKALKGERQSWAEINSKKLQEDLKIWNERKTHL